MTQLRLRIIELAFVPGNVFKLDFIGAIVSVISFCTIMIPLHVFFGVEFQSVKEIGIFTLCVSLISFCCFRFARNKHVITGLYVLIAANISYCVFTAVIMISNFDQITAPGLLYLNFEIAVILIIAAIEYVCVRRLINNRTR